MTSPLNVSNVIPIRKLQILIYFSSLAQTNNPFTYYHHKIKISIPTLSFPQLHLLLLRFYYHYHLPTRISPPTNFFIITANKKLLPVVLFIEHYYSFWDWDRSIPPSGDDLPPRWAGDYAPEICIQSFRTSFLCFAVKGPGATASVGDAVFGCCLLFFLLRLELGICSC